MEIYTIQNMSIHSSSDVLLTSYSQCNTEYISSDKPMSWDELEKSRAIIILRDCQCLHPSGEGELDTLKCFYVAFYGFYHLEEANAH